MKQKKLLIIALVMLSSLSFSQVKQTIRLGVKNTPNEEIEKQIANHEYNFVDAFEYELIKLLQVYAKGSEEYNLKIQPINQGNKLRAIERGIEVDAILFTFSETTQRIQDGIHFSIPYFQNKAIGVITNNEGININDIKNSTIRIGYVSNTTAQDELLSLNEKYKANMILTPYQNHKALIQSLKEKEIDVAAGDVSRLIYDVNEGDFYFGGNLPTKRSKVRDNYCIAITPLKGELKPFFDGFVSKYQKQIESLEEKWLSTALEDAYQSHYNKNEDKLKSYIKYIVIGGLTFLILFFLILNRIINKKNKEIQKLERKNIDEKIGEIAELYDAKGKASIGTSQIARIGCDFFKTAKKITYVGSGGFLSDENKELSKEWRLSMTEFMQKPNTEFVRVVDLPQMEVNSQQEVIFSEIYNFNPKRLPSSFISRYIRWLCIQYGNLKTYKNLKIIDSRGAALWGHGIVIMIKDQIEVLIFTTNRDTKIGSSIRDEKLAKKISEIISDVKEIGKEVNTEYIRKEFLMKDPRLIEIRKEIDSLGGKNITDEILKKIDITCDNIQKSNQ